MLRLFSFFLCVWPSYEQAVLTEALLVRSYGIWRIPRFSSLGATTAPPPKRFASAFEFMLNALYSCREESFGARAGSQLLLRNGHNVLSLD